MEGVLKAIERKELFLIAGPCVIEDTQSPISIASKLVDITSELGIPFVFKASYRKANRSRLDSFTGIGDVEGLRILKAIRDKFHIPVLTDIHSAEEAAMAADYVDVLQIPAFMCRQTDLLVAAAKTGKVVNIKKGQFLSPQSMQFAVDKVEQSGSSVVWLTERGTMFGYRDLIVDYRSIPTLKEMGCTVVMDGTHALQKPNSKAGVTGGQPEMIETICRAAVAVGVDGLFLETHPNPAVAKSDGANMIPLQEIRALLLKLIKIRDVIKEIEEQKSI